MIRRAILYPCVLVMLLFTMCGFSPAYAVESNIDIVDVLEPVEIETDSDAYETEIEKFVIGTELNEVAVSSGEVQFSAMSPITAFSFVELYPGQCIYYNELFSIVQGKDALGIHATWAETNAHLRIGLINESEDTIYAVRAESGFTTMLVDTENVPTGNYYVAVYNVPDNADAVFGAMAYSWHTDSD